MSKAQKSNREEKKQPALNLKEKRAAKNTKKDAKSGVQQPFMPKG